MAAGRTYLERYVSGEYEQVWDELVALGVAVRQEPLHADALAVARETMRRARANIDRLIPRLVRIGYLFGYGWLQPPAFQPFDWDVREWYRASLDWARKQPPILSSATDTDEELSSMRARLLRLRKLAAPSIIITHWEQRIAAAEAMPRVESEVDAFERDASLLPLSVRAWYEVVGGVNFVGMHPGWLALLREDADTDPAAEAAREWKEFARGDLGRPFHLPALLDPLFVYSLNAAPVWEDSHAAGLYHLALMPDRYSLFGEHGEPWARRVELPCPAADAQLSSGPRETTFVTYLRNCFRWGGFPGWEHMAARPEQDLSFLTEGLAPL